MKVFSFSVLFNSCGISLFLSVSACLFNWSGGKPLDVSSEWKREIIQRASAYFQHVGLPFLEKELSVLHIPEVKSYVGTPLGRVDYQLKGTRLADVSFKKTKVVFVKDQGIKIKADNCSLNIGSEWHYREQSWPHISDSGFCNVSMKDLAFALTFDTKEAMNGKNEIIAKNCSINVGSLKIKFSGGTSRLYNLFSDELADKLKTEMENRICVAVTNIIATKGNKALGILPGMVKKFFKSFRLPK